MDPSRRRRFRRRPRERYLELAPKHWPATRARLAPDELAKEIGPITVPPPATAEQQTAAD